MAEVAKQGYKVHAYITVRVPIQLDPGEASSHLEAIEKATDKLTQYSFRDKDAEDAEEITGFLVDEPNDPEYSKSTAYCGDGKTPRYHSDRQDLCAVCQQPQDPELKVEAS